jgi:hypothetical protein
MNGLCRSVVKALSNPNDFPVPEAIQALIKMSLLGKLIN